MSGFQPPEKLQMTSLRACTAVVVLLGSAFGTSRYARGLPTNASQANAPTFTHTLPPLQGDRLKVTLVEVTYAAGGSSPAHSHPCPVVGHVIEGSVRMGVKGEPERTFGAGESFYEPANGVHLVSRGPPSKWTYSRVRAVSTLRG